ncbi:MULTISPECIES: hypothetical protein [Deefgea]|uniref:FecR protein domain-containing protein n=1 Tax=Deefgea chitinilytica TaxID=570276 RepID=A0ABS2CDT2_9NEIS|nr:MULTISPECIES: hypothetical protein [Deefgea]MBM5571628.1 hypothetical protein [Deefgea chitinilytica]MBM9888863.1 hypothetical protein [Deefgea sp. CFH1-16]
MSAAPYRYPEISRRAVLQRFAAMLVLGGLLPWRQALAMQTGIVRLKGKVHLNGQSARIGQLVKDGDHVETFADAEVVFIVGKDAYLQRAGSKIRLESGSGSTFSQVLRVISGRVLGVFAKGDTQIQTPTVTLGIRGTGVYLEASADKTYVCLCYGTAEYIPLADPSHTITQTTQHHEKPLWIYADASRPLMAAAEPINHTDAELQMLEALVGRVPPFISNPSPLRNRY